MMRLLFILLIILTAGFLFLNGRIMERSSDKPSFLVNDEIAAAHQTKINFIIRSRYKPDSTQLEMLRKDYSDLWAHLNHLYETNDVIAGKEYYTESWFKQICSHYYGVLKSGIIRNDEEHNLIIQNWASDALVCTAIDSNLVFKYTYPDNATITTRARIALVLLYQGDHWRIDAMRVQYEN